MSVGTASSAITRAAGGMGNDLRVSMRSRSERKSNPVSIDAARERLASDGEDHDRRRRSRHRAIRPGVTPVMRIGSRDQRCKSSSMKKRPGKRTAVAS